MVEKYTKEFHIHSLVALFEYILCTRNCKAAAMQLQVDENILLIKKLSNALLSIK